jgi:hypothetical protein
MRKSKKQLAIKKKRKKESEARILIAYRDRLKVRRFSF